LQAAKKLKKAAKGVEKASMTNPGKAAPPVKTQRQVGVPVT